MDIILFGRQGSGKGTQIKNFVEEYSYTVFAMSAELKKVIAEGNELGQKIKSIIDAGDLVPDDVILELVNNFYENISSDTKILFDGFPRTLAQKEGIEILIEKFNRKTIGILIDISNEEAKKRLLGRKVCSVCHTPAMPDEESCSKCEGELIKRSDDHEEAILKRLDLYEKETKPVVDWYKNQNRLIEVNGEQPVEEVWQEITSKLNSILS